jgi:hypothetical protein
MLALQASDFPGAACCRDAQRGFLKDHASRWMPSFFNRVGRAEPDGPLSHAAHLGNALLREWCAAVEVPVGPDWLDLRPIGDGDVNISCSPSDGVAAVELGPTLAAAMESRK